VNDQGDILYVSARTGKYLEPAVGKANLNIFAMAREGLLPELSAAFRQALAQPGVVQIHNVKVGTNGGTQGVDLTIQPLSKPEALRGMVLVVFSDVAPTTAPTRPGPARSSQARDHSVVELESDVQRLKGELGSAREWMQSSQEELKSANEELQSSNEELQSTNEELTTSKEELQSMNEELQTLNAELQSKLEELSRANNDMINLLNSTEIATVFLDRDLKVRRFTDKATRVVKLIPGDVGRPLSDLVTDLDYPELSADACEVMRTLTFSQKEIATRDERWFLVRIMPYRTMENVIDGLVLTFIDISVAKKLEAELRGKQGKESPA
jgi:two-component system CheB/CheR fusion protein